MKRTLIHIGYPKAASTTLQVNLFDKHPEIEHLRPKSSDSENNEKFTVMSKFYYNLFMLNSIDYKYSNNLKFTIESIEPYMCSDKLNVFSQETILSPFVGDNLTKAQRLKEIFPEAKIMIVLRNQFDLIVSLYNYNKLTPFGSFIASKGNLKYLSFDKWINQSLQNIDINYSFLPAMKYYEHLNEYKQLFGKDNIGIFLFEELVENSNLFSVKISKFLGVNCNMTEKLLTENPQNTAKSSQYHNFRNVFMPNAKLSKFIPKNLYPLKEKLKQIFNYKEVPKPIIKLEHQEKIQDYFKKSNINLASEFNLEIDKYNYPM